MRSYFVPKVRGGSREKLPHAFDCADHNKLWKILQEMGIPDHLTCFLRNLYAGQEATVRTGRGTTDWLQIVKEVHQGVYCHPAFLTYMQSTSWEMLDWTRWSTNWNQDCWEKYQYPQICRWHYPYGRKWRKTKEPLDESERGERKFWLKACSTFRKQRSLHPVPSLHGK